MSFWFVSSFGVLPSVVFSRPFCFDPRVLPPFYSSLLLAWRGLNGSHATACNSLVFGSSCPHFCCPVADMSTKSCYLYLLSENMVPPHCVAKFSPMYGSLDWPSTIYVGRLRTASYTPHSVLFPLGCQFPPLVFVGLLLSRWSICSFTVPLPRVFSPGFSHCCSVFPSCVLLFFVDTFSSASALMSWLSPPGSLCIC